MMIKLILIIACAALTEKTCCWSTRPKWNFRSSRLCTAFSAADAGQRRMLMTMQLTAHFWQMPWARSHKCNQFNACVVFVYGLSTLDTFDAHTIRFEITITCTEYFWSRFSQFARHSAKCVVNYERRVNIMRELCIFSTAIKSHHCSTVQCTQPANYYYGSLWFPVPMQCTIYTYTRLSFVAPILCHFIYAMHAVRQFESNSSAFACNSGAIFYER